MGRSKANSASSAGQHLPCPYCGDRQAIIISEEGRLMGRCAICGASWPMFAYSGMMKEKDKII